MNIEAIFGKVRLLRALTSLDRAEFVRLAAPNASILTVGNNNQTSTFNSVIKDGGQYSTLALTKVGTGQFTLSGTNTYVGATTVNGGVLDLAKAGNKGTTITGGTLADSAASGSTALATPIAVNNGGGLAAGRGSGLDVLPENEKASLGEQAGCVDLRCKEDEGRRADLPISLDNDCRCASARGRWCLAIPLERWVGCV